MFKKFRITLEPCENLFLVSYLGLSDEKCKIIINNQKEIKLSLFFAISMSSRITQELISDPTKRVFYINNNFILNSKEAFYKKIEDIFNMKEIAIENEEELKNFAEFGRNFGNNELQLLLQEQNNLFQNEINEENAFSSLLQSKNLTLKHENNLLNFVLELCAIHKIYEGLFQYIFIQFCTVKYIEKLILYLKKEICTNYNMESIISCLSNRLLQEQIPVNPQSYMEKRLGNSYDYISNDSNPLYGILKREFQKDNECFFL